MRLPAVVSEGCSAWLLTSQSREREEEEGETVTGSHPFTDFFFKCCFHLSHFLSEKTETCPGYSLPKALVICHLLKTSLTQRQSGWQAVKYKWASGGGGQASSPPLTGPEDLQGEALCRSNSSFYLFTLEVNLFLEQIRAKYASRQSKVLTSLPGLGSFLQAL